jgi:hypothetical protein
VPPWWPQELAAATGARQRTQLTSRNWLQHRAERLRRLPEARWVHGVRLPDAGWVVNVHSQNRPERAARADTDRAVAIARRWAGGAPLVFGGDVNLRHPELPGLVRVAGNHVDHLFTDGRAAVAGSAEVLDRGPLSDHAPVAVTLA